MLLARALSAFWSSSVCCLSFYSLLVCVLSPFQGTHSSTIWPAMTLPFSWTEIQETHPSNPGLGTKICDREDTWLCGLYLSLEDLLGPLPDPECSREAQSLLSPLHLGGKTPKSAYSCVILFFHFTQSPQYQETEDLAHSSDVFRIQDSANVWGEISWVLEASRVLHSGPTWPQSLCWLPCHQGKGAVGNQLISPVLSHLEFCSPCCFHYSSVLWPFCFKISLPG